MVPDFSPSARSNCAFTTTFWYGSISSIRTRLGNSSRTRTHDQTLNIKRFGIHAPYLEATSTAEAARLIATDPAYRNSAAIASKEAAAGYGLKMLFENVEDEPDNVTRFHALSTQPAAPTGNAKTALIFQIANSRHVLHRVRELITVEGKDTPFVRALTSHDDPKSAFYCEFSGHEGG